MNGITIVAISEEQGKRLLQLLEDEKELLEQILERVKRIPGRAASLNVLLGKPTNQT
jgi:hypothetical protein